VGAPVSLLQSARAFARDYPRDEMPGGFLWDVADYVPTVIDANLTGRGAWLYGSTDCGSDVMSGILATFFSGDKLLVTTVNNRWLEVSTSSPYTATDRGTALTALQNPIQFVDTVVLPDGAGAAVPQLITAPGGTFTAANANVGGKHPKYACVYKGRLVTGGDPSELNVVRFSVPGFALTDASSYDTLSYIPTSQEVTALASLRAVILVFHKGAVERIRGNTPPFTAPTGSTDPNAGLGDMFLEPLFDRNGCADPKTIAYWQENVIFADEHGVQMTDGAIIRNLVSQGGILTYWRNAYAGKISMSGGVFLDYYLITINYASGPSTTLVCDLNRRQWFRLTNVPASTYIVSSGGASIERLWAGMVGTHKLGRLGPIFFPDPTTTPQVDDNGIPVLPTFETSWYRLIFGRALGHRLMREEGRSRVKFAYLSYDARLASITPNVLSLGYITSPQDTTYVPAGNFPSSSEYTRFRLPIGEFPYGIAFKVTQTQPTSALRVFDLGIEYTPSERSRV